MVEVIDQSLLQVDLVCITANCWTANYKLLMRVACHWIYPKTLERKNVCWACSCTFGKITNKVVLIVTDSVLNCIKTFKVFEHEGEKM